MTNNKKDGGSFGLIKESLCLCLFILKWSAKTNSWGMALNNELTVNSKKTAERAIAELNKLNRESSYGSLIIGEGPDHYNYFAVIMTNEDNGSDHICIGVVQGVDQGNRPCDLECMVFRKNDLESIALDLTRALNPSVRTIENDAEVKLTRRQKDILELLRQGHSQKEMAATLGIAESTIESHKSRLFSKFQVHSSRELISRAFFKKNFR